MALSHGTRRRSTRSTMEPLERRALLSSVSGVVYNDLDRDGVRDPGEPGLAGRTVFIVTDFDDVHRDSDPAAATDADGNYRIDTFAGGPWHYRMRLLPLAGWRRTAPDLAYHEFDLPAEANATGYDFGQARVPDVATLTLINADTDRPVDGVSLADGVTIDLATVGRRLSIRADLPPGLRGDLAPGTPLSVRFNYDGRPGYRVENAAPYAIGGDAAGDYLPWTPSVGTHTLVVTPYPGRSGTGERGESRTIVFNVVDSSPLPPPVRVNAGGGEYTTRGGDDFGADADAGFRGGSTRNVAVPVAGTSDDALYQSFRSGRRFGFSRAVPDGDYTLRLHFADPTSRRAGQRRFDVSAEGRVVLRDYDIVRDVGPRRAKVKSAAVTVRDGRLDLLFAADAGEAIVSAVELIPRAAGVAARGPLYVSGGGTAVTDSLARPFEAGRGFDGGSVSDAVFDVDRLEGDDEALFARHRSGGRFSFHRAVAPGNYTLLLDFAEPDAGAAAGSRTFDVFAEGRQILDDFDITRAAGGARKAWAEAFDLRVTDGSLDLEFRGAAGEAIVSAVVLLPTDVPEAVKPYSPDCAPEADRQARSARNLRILSQGVQMYANENKGRTPPDLAAVLTQDVPGYAFADPRAGTRLPRGETLRLVEDGALARHLNDYVYVGAGGSYRTPGETPLIHENPTRVAGPILVALFSGQVVLMDRVEAGRLIGFDPAVGPDALPDYTHSPDCRPDPDVTQSAQNLRALGQMAQRYANENRGRLPRDLGTLYAASDGDPALLVNPRGATPPPPAGLTREQKALYADAGTDYVYIGRGLNYTAPAEVVIAYENLAEMKDGINLMFADGRVEFREMRWAAEAIRRSLTYPRGWWA